MSRYRLDISGNIDLSDYSNINDYIELVESNDGFTVTFDKVSNENIDIVCSMLQEKDFIIKSKEDEKDGRTYISAIRRRQRHR